VKQETVPVREKNTLKRNTLFLPPTRLYFK